MNSIFERAISEAIQNPLKNPPKDVILVSSSSSSNKSSPKSTAQKPEFPSSSKKIVKQPFGRFIRRTRKSKAKRKIKFEKMQLRQSKNKLPKSSNSKFFLESIKQRLSEIKDIKNVKFIAEKLKKEFLSHFEGFDRITIEKLEANQKKLLFYLEEMKKVPRSPELVILYTELIERKKKLSEKKFWSTFNKLPFQDDGKKPILTRKRKRTQKMETIKFGAISLKKEQKQEITEKKTGNFLSVFEKDLSFTEKQLERLKKYYQKIENLYNEPKNQGVNENFKENNENSDYSPISKNIGNVSSTEKTEKNNNELNEIEEESSIDERSNKSNENLTENINNFGNDDDDDDDGKNGEDEQDVENNKNSEKSQNDESSENRERESEEPSNNEEVHVVDETNKAMRDEENKGEASIQTERKEAMEVRKVNEMPSANFFLQGMNRIRKNENLKIQKTKFQKPVSKKELSSQTQVIENLLFKQKQNPTFSHT